MPRSAPNSPQTPPNTTDKGNLPCPGDAALKTALSASAHIYRLRPPEPDKPGPSDPCAAMPIPTYTISGRGCA